MAILLVTGLGGTVGAAVYREAIDRGWDVRSWDRRAVNPDDREASLRHLAEIGPAGILHLGMGPPRWAGDMSGYAAEHGIPFIFTSTGSVFAPHGPHGIHDQRTATDDYGRYKQECEDEVAIANPDAVTVRLGYQISLTHPGNNMGAHLREEAVAHHGVVRASTRWIPAAAMLEDTVAVLLNLVATPRAGLHHLDANSVQGWNYAQLARAISLASGANFRVQPTEDPDYDGRLLNTLPIPMLGDRLPLREEPSLGRA